tara:strand:+ start:505 stop:777 length:273 start_codon:yes stop_codon:yes gene_type:complete
LSHLPFSFGYTHKRQKVNAPALKVAAKANDFFSVPICLWDNKNIEKQKLIGKQMYFYHNKIRLRETVEKHTKTDFINYVTAYRDGIVGGR